MSSFVTGPIAAENNPPIEPQWFQPSRFPITAIAYGATTTVTMGTAVGGVTNNYVVGQLTRLTIPSQYGASKLNEKQGYVISTSATQVILDIDTSIGYDAFIPNPSNARTTPSICAIGDINTGGINAQGRRNNAVTIQGTFKNISPSAGG